LTAVGGIFIFTDPWRDDSPINKQPSPTAFATEGLATGATDDCASA